MPDMVINKEIVESKLARLKTDKSPGLDQLHPRVLYECREVISYPLYIIYMKSLSLGILPTDWKLAEVTALLSIRRVQNLTGETTGPSV